MPAAALPAAIARIAALGPPCVWLMEGMTCRTRMGSQPERGLDADLPCVVRVLTCDQGHDARREEMQEREEDEERGDEAAEDLGVRCLDLIGVERDDHRRAGEPHERHRMPPREDAVE